MKKFNPKEHTDAPQQIHKSRLIPAPIEKVWSVVADHKGMTQWMPFIKHVELVAPDSAGSWGEGCERHCQFGSDLLKETIAHWDPPYGYAYSIADMHLVADHLGHIALVEKLDGTLVSWTQYYNPQGNALKKWMAKNVMLPKVMSKALKNLEKQTAS